MNEVTFIIPTMGRQTLERAISSLGSQTNPHWRAIVVYDGNYEINYVTPKENIKIVKANTAGHAGLVRNYGIELVETDWMAFLDDDDWVDKSYVEKLQSISNSNPEFDIIVFTYKDVTNGNTIPPKGIRDIEACKVGISFAVRTSFIKNNGIRFTPFSIEDFRFLDECRSKGAKYHISTSIQYFVGGRGGWLRKD